MISLDANVVLRFLVNDIPGHSEKAAQLIQKERVYVTDVVVVEVIYVLENAFNLPRKDVAKLIKSFLGFNNLTYNPWFLFEAINMYELHPALSIVDCYAASESKLYKNQLVTFDKILINQGGSHVKGI